MTHRFKVLMLCVSILSCASTIHAQVESKTARKLRTIIIDHLVAEDMNLEEFIALVRVRAKDLDPDKEGVNIVVHPSALKTAYISADKAYDKTTTEGMEILQDKKITMLAEDIPLGDLIRSLCIASDVLYRVEEYAVVIFPKEKTQEKGKNNPAKKK